MKKTTFKEQTKKEFEQMLPARKAMIKLGVPLYLIVGVFGTIGGILLDVFVMGSEEGPGWLTFVALAFFVLASASLIACNARVSKLEQREGLERLAYLFEPAKPFEDDCVVLEPTHDEFTYVVKREGIIVQKPHEEGEQVFDEVDNGTLFLPWDRVDVLIVTHNMLHRAEIGLAIVNIDALSEDENLFVLPMNEKLYQALHAFDVAERLEEDWKYLRYNPKDAIKQIVNLGRVIVLRDKDTGKRIREDEFYKG